MTLLDPSLVVNELLEQLRAELVPLVGDGAAPADVRQLPYYVLHTIPGGMLSGSFADQHEDLELVVQLNATGGNREQAQFALAAGRAVVLGRTNGAWSVPLAGAGWVVYHREHDMDGGVERVEQLHTATDRYRLHVTRRAV